jgi:hypothetical protein
MSLKSFKLFENPQSIPLDNSKNINYNDEDQIVYAFTYIDDEIVIDRNTVNYDENEICGAYFQNMNILTFWNYPADNEQLIEIIEDIESELGIDIWNNPVAMIEVIVDDDGNVEIPCGDWKNKDDADYHFLLPIKEYNGENTKNIFSDEKGIGQTHTKNAIEKEEERKQGYRRVGEEYWNLKKKKFPFEERWKKHRESIITKFNKFIK